MVEMMMHIYKAPDMNPRGPFYPEYFIIEDAMDHIRRSIEMLQEVEMVGVEIADQIENLKTIQKELQIFKQQDMFTDWGQLHMCYP